MSGIGAIAGVASSGWGSAMSGPTAAGSSADATASSGALPNANAIQAAQKDLAKANSNVAQDKRNHSPSCVAFDQKQADKAQQKLTQAEAQAQAEGASQAQIKSGLSILA